jgi:hypothetical protein
MVLDPRFMLAFALGVILDLLSYIFMGLDAGIVAGFVNATLGWMIVWLMVSLSKDKDRSAAAQQRGNEMRQQAVTNARQGRKGLQQRRELAQGMLGNKAAKKRFKRWVIMYVGSAIPIINFIPFWTIGAIMLLREK